MKPSIQTRSSLFPLSLSLESLSTMQRQSLGSSVGKLQSHGGGEKVLILPTGDVDRLKDLHASSSPSSTIECDEEDDRKASKRQRFASSSSSSPTLQKFIHIIPILTIFCFLVLYICSYTPSQSDLAQFRGFKGSLKFKDSSGIGGEVDPFSDLEKGKISAIQTLRSLQGIGSEIPISRSHRKMAGFQLS